MNPSDEDVKEVYAQFGLAYYFSEVLHRGLCNLYAYSRARHDTPLSWPRFEEHLKEAHQSTFGRVVKTVTPFMSGALLDEFRHAVERRNFLAHHFWYDRIHLLSTNEGCVQACDELTLCCHVFQALDGKIEGLLAPLLSQFGVSSDHWEAALLQARSGQGPPLLSHRHPDKEEVVIAVYEVGESQGVSALIFETQDRALWQLCDAGLGWAAFESVGPDWVPSARFDGILPAHINPRPKCTGPWDYRIFLGKGASLVVRPGGGKAAFLWSLRRKGG